MDQLHKVHVKNPLPILDNWRSLEYKPGRYKRLHGWAQSGVKLSDVRKIIDKHRVALLECEL